MADYIEREAFLSKIARMINYAETNGMGRELTVLFQVGDAAMDCPTADVAPVVHGRWEDVRENVSILRCSGFPMTTTAETCTVCRFRSCFVGPKSLLHDGICPNCGAKMDGEAQHE